MTEERRAHARKRVSTSVMFRDVTGGESLRGWLPDISQGGGFFAWPTQLTFGEVLEFDMRIPGVYKPLSGKAKVIWVREKSERERPAGMGIEFVGLDADALVQIETLRGSSANLS